MKLAALQQVCNDLAEVETLKDAWRMDGKDVNKTCLETDGYSLLNWTGKHAEYNTLLFFFFFLKGIIQCMTA